jgi:imidazolonepropionase-like amidohydrolase
VTTKGNDIQARQFSDEELSAIVAEAERNNMLVAAHCHGNAGILAALRAGCKTIEHATFLEDDGLSLMVEKDSMLIATRTALEMSIQHPEAWTPAQYEQLKAIKKRHKESYSKAVRAGVRIALVTDIATSAVDKPWNRHGINGMEFQYAVEAGMTPLQAIEAGTANAPDTLGPQAPKSGWLKEGYDADFIALYHNPLDDIEILGDARNITYVWKGGKLVKKDGQPINILG